jgi:hypothetical protein
MNHRERLQQIIDFLKPYQKIWQNEIMLEYPLPFKHYPLSWVKELAAFTEKSDVIRLEKKDVKTFLKDSELLRFYESIEELSQVKGLPEINPLPIDRFTFLYTIPKKQHEIKRLAPFVHSLVQEQHLDHVIDIGGGIGKLAQTLSYAYNINMVSIDMDPVLQETGVKRHKKTFKGLAPKVKYVTAKVDRDDATFKKLLSPQSLTLGLHTCGSLANHQIMISAAHKISSILNFGCCYHKLEFDPEGQNISQFTKNHPEQIELSHFALALSARAHRKMEEEDYDLKQKVKAYRYGIHFLLYDFYGKSELTTLGNSSPKLYDEDFGTYALDQLARINITSLHTHQELNDYFMDSKRQEMIWEMTASGLMRNALGRLLEMYILLDRCIYLEEQNYKVELLEFFDEGVSPRNLGLLATRMGAVG